MTSAAGRDPRPADARLLTAEVADRERGLEWAESRVAVGHHRNCATRTLVGCDCYFAAGEYAAARALLPLAVRVAVVEARAANAEAALAEIAGFAQERRWPGPERLKAVVAVFDRPAVREALAGRGSAGTTAGEDGA